MGSSLLPFSLDPSLPTQKRKWTLTGSAVINFAVRQDES